MDRGGIMAGRVKIINENVDRFVQNLRNANRSNQRQSQTIDYDAGAMKAIIDSACGLKPIPGTQAADRWRVHADRVLHHELDRLRAASGVSVAQTVTFKPINEPPA
jgi:hypothetical protein